MMSNGKVGTVFSTRSPGANWRPDDISKESPYSVSSSTIASGVVKRTRTFHASDRQDMGAESAATFTTKVPWELQDVLPRMQLTPRVAKLLDPSASVPSSPAKPLPNLLSKFDSQKLSTRVLPRCFRTSLVPCPSQCPVCSIGPLPVRLALPCIIPTALKFYKWPEKTTFPRGYVITLI